MPEGDSIHRIPNRLAPLVGKRLEHATTQGLVRHIAGAGRASLALTVDTAVYLWVQARTVEIAQRRAPMRGMAVASLGPDILAADFDLEAAATRAATYPARMISEVLLDQRVVAGIGNIWKSESLFAAKVDPRTRVAELAAEQLEAIYRAAREKMQGSVRGGLSPSEPMRGDRYAVYSRTGQPCRACATPIDAYRLGDPPRWTWSCRTCQVLPPPGGVCTAPHS